MVPIKEMTDILHVVKTRYGIKKGSWIRIKRGIYFVELQVDKSKEIMNIKYFKVENLMKKDFFIKILNFKLL
jgi:hypothetical protein